MCDSAGLRRASANPAAPCGAAGDAVPMATQLPAAPAAHLLQPLVHQHLPAADPRPLVQTVQVREISNIQTVQVREGVAVAETPVCSRGGWRTGGVRRVMLRRITRMCCGSVYDSGCRPTPPRRLGCRRVGLGRLSVRRSGSATKTVSDIGLGGRVDALH